VLGARVLGAGSSAMIPGKTLYGFSAGADGLRYLNFRGKRDATFQTKEQVHGAAQRPTTRRW
ncbi:MAG: hypothetical protein ABI658_27405, partial [Acidimicrobiales bacterium]